MFAAAVALAMPAWPAAKCDAGVSPPIPTSTPFEQPRGPSVGLALGSGSYHALAHIGVIEALEAAHVNIRVVSGTSAGALIGSLWASGMPGREIERLAVAEDWGHLGSFTPSSSGLMSNARIRAQLDELFGGRPIESWPRRFGAVATDVDNGHRRLLMTGSGASAVQASTAMPVLFEPVILDGVKLADGALVEPVPVTAAREMGADYVIAIDVAYRPYEEPVSGIAGYAFQAMHILVNTLAERQLRDADLVIRLDLHHLMGCGPAVFVAAGRDAMARALPELAKGLARRAAEQATP